jgi:two-component system sensor kinase FixL
MNVQCEFNSETDLPRVDNVVALHLYYIVQEAVLNAAKHAKPSRIVITLAPAGDRLALSVEDDGCGFRPAADNDTGMGIRIMRYRARMIGATLDLKSRPGRGTQVTCVFDSTSRIPWEMAHHDRKDQ